MSIGRLIEEKGYIYIFSAIKKIITHYPDITLDIYGNGPLEKDLSNYIKENNLSDSIFNVLLLEGLRDYMYLLDNSHEQHISKFIQEQLLKEKDSYDDDEEEEW